MLITVYLKRCLFKTWNNALNCMYKERHNIITAPTKVFELLFSLKPESWEKLYVSEVYKINKEYTVDCFCGEHYVLSVNNARVQSNSDIVVTPHGVLWDKYHKTSFTKTIPLDSNLIRYNNGEIVVKKNKKIVYVDGHVISMNGVHSKVWSHFLIMYLPRLYYSAIVGLLNNKVTLLLPCYNDEHIKQIINDFLSGYPNVSIVEMNDTTDYLCSTLYYLPSFSNATDHSSYCMSIDFLIPENVVTVLNQYLVKRYINNIDKIHKKRKIYLVRRNTSRSVINWEEIEVFFQSKGFEIVEPHKVTLQEKINMFYNASIIAGPYSAAFTNLLFCNNARVLIISPLMRSVETYYCTIAQETNIRVLNVTGDDKCMSPHTDYIVPINRIEDAYNKLINEMK